MGAMHAASKVKGVNWPKYSRPGEPLRLSKCVKCHTPEETAFEKSNIIFRRTERCFQTAGGASTWNTANSYFPIGCAGHTDRKEVQIVPRFEICRYPVTWNTRHSFI